MKRAVVIGSGMGGLTSALLLQKQGFDVTVLEQHTRPGGLLHRFFRKGVAYDTGFHYCGSVSAGDALGQILRHIGVFDDLTFHDLDPNGFDRLAFPGLSVDIPTGWDAYEQRLIETFPHERDGLHTLLATMRKATEPYGLYHLRPDSDLERVLDVEGALLMDVFRQHITDPHLMAVLSGQAVLYGVRPSEASFGVHCLILDHFLRGATTLDGGGDRLAMALTRKIRANGGRVLLRHEVVEVITDGRTATGVRTASETFDADLVISNLHPRLTLDLLPPEATRRAYKSRVAGTPVGHAHMGVYYEVEGRVPELGRRNLYQHRSFDLDACYRPVDDDGLGLYFASSPTEHHGGSDRSVVLQVAPLSWDQVAPWANTTPQTRPAAYVQQKQRWTDACTRALLTDHPSLAGRIVRAEASTPLSTQHFTRTPHGAMYGHLHSRDQMGRMRPSARVRLKNMMLVGQGVFSPGVLGTALSAYYAMGHLFGLEPLLAELRSA